MTPRRAIIIFFIILGLITALGLIFRDFIHEAILVPLNYLFWVANQLIRSLDQIVIWLFAMFFFLLLMMRSLITERQPPEYEPTQPRWSGSSRKRFWWTEVHLLITGRSPSRYPVHEIRKLVTTVLAYTHHLGIKETEDALKADALEIPPGTWKQLEFEEDNQNQATDWWAEIIHRLRHPFKPRPLNVEHPRLTILRDLIEIMENQLEIPYDRRDNRSE
jgi:hypothetical protein